MISVLVAMSGAYDVAFIRGVLRGMDGVSVVTRDREGDQEDITGEHLDVVIFSTDGRDGAWELFKATAPYRVAIMSGPSPDDVRAVMRSGVCDVLLRPLDTERLLYTLNDIKAREDALGAISYPVRQSDVDMILDRSRKAPGPSGRVVGNARVTDAIRSALATSAKGLSASQIANILHVSRITARKYCEALMAAGYVRAENEYRKKGRPVKIYVRID